MLELPQFRHAHPTVWNAVFCDGAVRAISYNMALPTMPHWQVARPAIIESARLNVLSAHNGKHTADGVGLVIPAISGAFFRLARRATIYFARFTAVGQKFFGELVQKLPNAGRGWYDWAQPGHVLHGK